MAIENATAIVLAALSAWSAGLLKPSSPSPSPVQLHDPYWGPGESPMSPDLSIRPFNIDFSDEMVNDLRYRLAHSRKLQPSLENAASTYGINSEYLPKVIDYWLHDYNFKEREAHLNQFPQYVTNVQGLDIHYIHAKPQLPKDSQIEVLPLLLLHGWSGSLAEFYKIIPKLTAPAAGRNFVFEVIAPSLPGFGFSDAAAKIGLGHSEMATVLKNLMGRIGYDKFYMQGGDWGGMIIAKLAMLHPENVLGMHSNFCVVLTPKNLVSFAYYSVRPSELPEKERPYQSLLDQLLYEVIERNGYFHVQATRPDTLGVALNDSPAGLAAYILEKFYELTSYDSRFSNDGNLSKYFTMDELIDNLMFYWVPRKITSSMRIYAESQNIRALSSKVQGSTVTVPSACAHFPNEIYFMPGEILREIFTNLVQHTLMPRGGHYAALEEPQLLADDVFAAIEKMRDLKNSHVQSLIEGADCSLESYTKMINKCIFEKLIDHLYKFNEI